MAAGNVSWQLRAHRKLRAADVLLSCAVLLWRGGRSNIGISHRRLTAQQFFAGTLTVGLCVLWTFPVTIIAMLKNINELGPEGCVEAQNCPAMVVTRHWRPARSLQLEVEPRLWPPCVGESLRSSVRGGQRGPDRGVAGGRQ